MKEIYIVSYTTGEYEDTYTGVLKVYEDKDKAFKFLNDCKEYFKNQFDDIIIDGMVSYMNMDEDYLRNSPCGYLALDYNGVWFRIEGYKIEE